MMLRTVSIVLAVVVLLPILALAALSLFSRAPTGLGVSGGRLAACPGSPNCVCSFDPDATHAIEPLRYAGSPDDAWTSLASLVAVTPRTKIVEQTGDYLRAEATTRLFRFVDDVEFLLDRTAGVIHVRSASRAGHSDLGVNRARVEELRVRFGQGQPAS